MPWAAQRPCSTCGTVGCTQHIRPAWGHAQPVYRIRGRKLQALRKQLFTEHPLCEACEKQGLVTLATIRDHIIPLSAGTVDTPTNEGCQALCQDCSDAKTAREALQGRGVARC